MIGLGWLTLFLPNQTQVRAQEATPLGVFITVTYTDPINVRGGPSTITYPIVGHLNPGDAAPALGVSPGREWIQISYAGAPGGVGWVYASFVSISAGTLQVVEPPPTPVPLITATIDPTLAAAFVVPPTGTRMPTFTPPPPLNVPRFMDGNMPPPNKFPTGIFIAGLGLIGLAGLAVSFMLRRQ